MKRVLLKLKKWVQLALEDDFKQTKLKNK
jgi:hypothetical protein